MNILKKKKITAIIIVFTMLSGLFVGIDFENTVKAESSFEQKSDIEWQMFLKERNHTNTANPMEIGIMDPVINWDKGYDVISWGTTIGNFAENIEGDDYNKEISHVVFIYEADVEDENENTYVLCISDGANGETMWEYYFDSEETKTTPALAYLDDDLKLDIVFGVNNGTIFAIEPVIYFSGSEYGITNESEFLWDYKTDGEFTESSPTIADLNNDGTDDIIISFIKEEKSYLRALNGKNGVVIGKKELTGNMISTPAVMGDPIEYVIVTTLDTENELLFVYGFDSSLNEKVLEESYSAYKGRFDYKIPSPSIVDLDSDGDLDIIVAATLDPDEDDDYGWIYALDIQSNKPEHWNDVKIKGHIGGSLAVSDGKIVVQSYYYDWTDSITVITVLNYEGEEMWKTEYNTDSEVYVDRAVASPILADLNDDGILDIISSTTPNIIAFDGNSSNNKIKQLWAVELDEDRHTLYESPSAGNINGDNLLDLMIDGVLITTRIPDLYITPVDIEFYVDDKEVDIVDESDEVKIKAWVHNKGSEKAENVIVRFFDDDKKIGQDQKIQEIHEDGRSFAEIIWDTAGEGGENYIKIIVDPDNNIKEAYENNNRAVKKITVREPYKVTISCEDNQSSTDPGNFTTYEILVNNEGSRSDEIELSFSEPPDESWEILLDTEKVELPAGGSGTVLLSVKPSNNALAEEQAEIMVTATSLKDNHHPVPSSDSLTTLTIVNAVYGVELNCEYNSKQVNPNQWVKYKIDVKNLGNTEDTIKMQITNSEGWSVDPSNNSLTLPAFFKDYIYLRVKGDSSYIEGKQAKIIVTGKSQSDENKSSSVETTSTISQLMCDNYVQEVFPEEQANFTIGITNFGNKDRINLTLIGGEGWDPILSQDNVTLEAIGDHTTVFLTVTIPKGTIPFTEKEVTIIGDFESGNVQIGLLTIAKPYYKVNLSYASEENQSIYPGNSVNYLINVKNNGTAPDIIKLSYVFVDINEFEIIKPKGWSVKFEKDEVVLGPSTSEPIVVNITASNQAIFGDHFIKIIGTSTGNSSKKDTLILITYIFRVYGVKLICIEDSKFIDPGKNTFYSIKIINEGNDRDIVNIKIDDSNSPENLVTNLYPSGEKVVNEKVNLKAYEETNITLHLTISDDYSIAYANAIALIIVNGTLMSNETIINNVTTYTKINQIYDIALICETNESEVFPDAKVIYSIELINNGNGQDSVDFTYIYIDENDKKINPVDGWTVIINGSPELKNVTIGRGKKTTIELKVISPSIDHKNAHEGFTVKVKVTGISAGVDTNSDDNEVITETKVKQVYGLELSCKYPERNVIPGEFITYKLLITNKGNGIDTFSLELINENEDWFVEVIGEFTTVTLDGYDEEKLIRIKVTAPEHEDTHWDDIAEIIVITKSKNGTVDESDDIYRNITTKTRISQVMCEDNEHNVDPSDYTTYDIKIMNFGKDNGVNISLELSEIQDGWNAEFSKKYVILNAWEKTSVTLNITAPPKDHENAFAGNMFFINITGTTSKYGGRSDTVLSITTVNLVFDVELESPTPEINVDLSKLTEGTIDVEYDIKVWNRGNGENAIFLEVLTAPNDWNFILDAKNPSDQENNTAEFVLKAGDFGEASLTIEVPYDSLAGLYETKIKGSPILGDKDNSDVLKLTTIVDAYYKLDFVKDSDTIKIKEGESKTHQIELENNGNSLDNVKIEIENIPAFWDVIINPKNFALSAQTPFNFTVDISVPKNTKENLATLRIIANSQNDNSTTVDMLIIVNVEMLPNPDLFIQSIEFSNDNPDPGDEIIITAIIKNKGEKNAELFTVVFYSDDEKIFDPIISIDGSSSQEVKFNWTAEKGKHIIKVVVDPDNKIIESDEDNNEQTKDIKVGSEEKFSFVPVAGIFIVVVVIGLLFMLKTGKLEEILEGFKESRIATEKAISDEDDEEKEDDEEDDDEEDDDEEEEKEEKKHGVSIKLDDVDEDSSEKGVSIESKEEDEEIYTSCPECSANIKVPKEKEFKCPICKATIKLEKEEEKTTFPVIATCPSSSCDAKIKIKKAGKFECPKCKTSIFADETGEISEMEKVFPIIARCPSCDAKLKISKAGEIKCPKCDAEIEVDEEGELKEKELEEWEEESIFPMVKNCPSCASKIKISKPGMFKCPKCSIGIEVDIEGNLKEKLSVFPMITNCPSCQAKIKISKYGLLKCPKCLKKIKVDKKGNVKMLEIELDEEDLDI